MADGVHTASLQLAVATTGCDVAQTLNMLFGNSSLHAHVELVDVEFPPNSSRALPDRDSASPESGSGWASRIDRSPARR